MKNKESTEDEIVDFFKDQSGEKYSSLKKQIELHDREIAGLLNQKAIGDVLSIGGVWEFFEWNSQLKSLTILDLSKEMLEDYAPENSIPIVGNLFTHEFNSQQFDAVVFPFDLVDVEVVIVVVVASVLNVLKVFSALQRFKLYSFLDALSQL